MRRIKGKFDRCGPLGALSLLAHNPKIRGEVAEATEGMDRSGDDSMGARRANTCNVEGS